MRFAYVFAALAVPIYAHPSMNNLVNELMSRQADDSTLENDEIAADLHKVSDSSLTSVGQEIRDLLARKGNPQTTEHYGSVPDLGSDKCQKDTCCVWSYIGKEMRDTFLNPDDSCNRFARQMVRLGFHDCITHEGRGKGGCDGSVVNSKDENARVENKGMQEITSKLKQWFNKYEKYGITMADLIQFGASVAVHTCPGGPSCKVFMGRQDTNDANPPNLVPTPFDTAEELIKKFKAKSLDEQSLASLVGSHTISQQFVVDPKRAGDPQDSTPTKWDQKYYVQTLDQSKAPSNVFSFASDINLAKDKVGQTWFQIFATDKDRWDNAYCYGFIRLSLLGTYNLNDLHDCSKALPV
ncbi:Versatile peroxidase VPL1 like protein [Verticillium longisporum]|uniref:Peroxidase n=1 Tax=Verticillium longisporum TaxID=100787 RepID=A0A8I2ZZW1_VERLO|nr:Versatile peroxidase VPL1 like protein [Verticillium longisporum]